MIESDKCLYIGKLIESGEKNGSGHCASWPTHVAVTLKRNADKSYEEII